jgi:hypothetical protein
MPRQDGTGPKRYGPVAPGRPIDWRKLDRQICEAFHMTPAAIDQMTLPEICNLLGSADSSMDRDEMDAELMRWARMSNKERLASCKIASQHG